MCVALILAANSFYKVYYRLFDICEHALVSALLLLTILIIFVPLLFVAHSDTARPLFTIAVLVTGVVGGLAVVITVVYFYKFCLKKRPALATTGKPEWKREQIRSTASSQCRPLPVPLMAPAALAAKATAISTHEAATETRDLIFDAASAAPILFEKQHAATQSFFAVSPLDEKGGAGIGEIAASKRTSGEKVYLTVQPPSRAHSVELIVPPGISGDNDEDPRRASFDAPRGTGRQLPSTEHLEVQLFLFSKVSSKPHNL